MTPDQALEIYYAHDIGVTLDDREEVELLEGNNPLLLEAYRALAKFTEEVR